MNLKLNCEYSMWKSNLSLSTPGMSPAIKAIKAMRYMWSAIDSGPFIPWLIHPFLFVVYGINTNTKFTTIHHFPILTNQATNLSSNLVSPVMWQLSIIAMQEAIIDLINERSMMSAVSFAVWVRIQTLHHNFVSIMLYCYWKQVCCIRSFGR